MSVEDQVVDFYYSLFETIFTEPFRSKIPERLKRDAITRQVQDAAGAASQSLTRFLLDAALRQILRTLTKADKLGDVVASDFVRLVRDGGARLIPQDSEMRLEFAALARNLVGVFAKLEGQMHKESTSALESWAVALRRGNRMKAREVRRR